MDERYSSNYAHVACCLIIASNLVYLLFIFTRLFFDHQRRQDRKLSCKMSEKQSDTTATSRITTSTLKLGSERLAQLYPHVNSDTPLPSKWNGKEKAPTLVLQQNNLIVTYKGKQLRKVQTRSDQLSLRARTWKIAQRCSQCAFRPSYSTTDRYLLLRGEDSEQGPRWVHGYRPVDSRR